MLVQLDLDKIQNIGLPTFALRSGGRTSADVGRLISDILPYIFYGAGILLLIYMIFGGFQLMFAKGDPKAMQSAQGKITNALIGFVIVIIAYFLVKLMAKIFGLVDFF